MRHPFSGSYVAGDVDFLLRPVEFDFTDRHEKEVRIQTGASHYSEMLSREQVPSRVYLDAYDRAMEQFGPRLARDCAALAKSLATGPAPVLVSLVRAGVPVAVVLRRLLASLGIDAPHYGISIIRDRGIDSVALDWIVERHGHTRVWFVDGWTGKGAIRGELDRALSEYRGPGGARVHPRLAVVADLAGVADLAVSDEDYLIPSALLNSIVSGLISRSILNDQVVGPGEMHACVYYEEYGEADRSRAFVDQIEAWARPLLNRAEPAEWTASDRERRATSVQTFLEWAHSTYGITNPNRVKPGLGEATRAFLRRVPSRLLLTPRSADDPDTLAIRQLAGEHETPVDIVDRMPYRAATVIQKLG